MSTETAAIYELTIEEVKQTSGGRNFASTIRVGFLILERFGVETAVDLITAGIQQLKPADPWK